MPTYAADCPHCGELTPFNPAVEPTRMKDVYDAAGEKHVIYLVPCRRCGQEVPAGGKDGRGNV